MRFSCTSSSSAAPTSAAARDYQPIARRQQLTEPFAIRVRARDGAWRDRQHDIGRVTAVGPAACPTPTGPGAVAATALTDEGEPDRGPGDLTVLADEPPHPVQPRLFDDPDEARPPVEPPPTSSPASATPRRLRCWPR